MSQQDPSPSSNAQAQVLDNPYLLAQILEYLCMRDLLRIQLVSSSWKIMIDTNTKIQQTLFLKPIQPLPEAMIRTDVEDHDHWRYCRATISRPPESFSDKHRLFPVHVAHPLVGTSHASEMAGMTTREECDEIWDLINSDERASWRRMYICQPPLEEVKFLYTVCGLREEDGDDEKGDTSELIVQQNGGVTWGYLFDQVRGQADFAQLYQACDDEVFYIDAGEVCFQFSKPSVEDGIYCDLCDRTQRDLIVEI
ncbi:hypothetical protein BDZ85DRAFT_43470 [Elsinoe ampelina]|uniref:F-box domain-containing protein n=1 Tax=Elsinoe ampelina TaxID=302913 RepID=A0A6A6G1D3_9PEZI|nr:hypothetical protein BDZ85DRAFT_43470 [Elsinoe ampelina]